MNRKSIVLCDANASHIERLHACKYPRLVCYPQTILTNLSSYYCSYAIVIWLILGSRLAVATLVNTNESSPGSVARSRRAIG